MGYLLGGRHHQSYVRTGTDDLSLLYNSLRWHVFKNMEADGYSLDQKRTEITENDIPDVVARFHHLETEAQRSRKDKSFLVPVEEIRKNDYVLSISKYKEVEREKVEYESTEVIQGRIEALESEITAAIQEFRTKFM